MFELADRLVGIYKTFDATKSVTINPKVFAQATTGMLKSSEDVTEGEEKSARSSTNQSTKNSQVEKKITTTLGDATNTRVMA
jgi:structural maintenance of chromosome 4